MMEMRSPRADWMSIGFSCDQSVHPCARDSAIHVQSRGKERKGRTWEKAEMEVVVRLQRGARQAVRRAVI